MGIPTWRILLCFLVFEMFGVSFFEFFNSPGCIHKFLLAGEERMTGGADLDAHGLVDAAQLELVAAGTDSFDFVILRMDIGFHIPHSLMIIYL